MGSKKMSLDEAEEMMMEELEANGLHAEFLHCKTSAGRGGGSSPSPEPLNTSENN